MTFAREAWLVAGGVFGFFGKINVAVYRMTGGRVMGHLRGMPVLLLTTVGRKTRKARTTPVMYMRDGESYVVTASNNGRDRDPAWFGNLVATPSGEIEIPGSKIKVKAEVANPSERARLWALLVAKARFFDAYAKATSRSIPMVFLRPE